MVKSAELNSAVNLLVLTLLMLALGRFLSGSFAAVLVRFLEADSSALSEGNITPLLYNAVGDFFLLAGPVFLTALVAGLLVNYMQVGFLFTTETLNPQLNRLNPVEGAKRLLSKRALFELVKALLKVVLIGVVAFTFVRGRMEQAMLVLYQDAGQIWGTMSGLLLQLSLRVAVVFLALAVLDYIYQRYEYNENLKMTRQEVKEELRQMEGDPQLKSRLREQQRKIAMQRMMQEIPRATVVITNPTHLAVALRYREGDDRAPMVVAKGAALVAARIREVAAEHGVPIVENREVARLLYDQVEIGQEIPVDIYQAVAEILALVYRLKEERP